MPARDYQSIGEVLVSLKAEFPEKTIVADMKTMDAGRTEVEYAAKAGAGVVGVLGAASDSTIKECAEAARNYGCKLIVDMIEVADPVARAKRAQELGADYIGIHTAIDQQMRGEAPFETLRAVAEAVVIPVSVAGGINSETAAAAVDAGAGIVVVGGAIIKSADAAAATTAIRRAVDERVCIETVEEGKMTKDLALLIGPDQPWQTTQEFLASIDENLEQAMA